MEHLIVILTLINGLLTISSVLSKYVWKAGYPIRHHVKVASNLELVKFVLLSILEIDVGHNTSMNCKTLLNIFEREWKDFEK